MKILNTSFLFPLHSFQTHLERKFDMSRREVSQRIFDKFQTVLQVNSSTLRPVRTLKKARALPPHSKAFSIRYHEESEECRII